MQILPPTPAAPAAASAASLAVVVSVGVVSLAVPAPWQPWKVAGTSTQCQEQKAHLGGPFVLGKGSFLSTCPQNHLVVGHGKGCGPSLLFSLPRRHTSHEYATTWYCLSPPEQVVLGVPPYGGLARTGLSLLYVRLDGDDGSERNRASWTQIQIRHRIISEGRESGVPSVFLPNSVQLLKAYWVGGDTPEP